MNSSIRFLLSSSSSNLQFVMDKAPSATVEAEYGEVCVTGSLLTMAHHGPRAGQPAPCSYENGCADGVEVVGISHVDLDTLGGCAAVISRKPEAPSFWALAEFVDLNGAHKLGVSGANDEDLRRLHAFWAWSEAHRVYAARDGSVTEVTDQVIAGISVIEGILAGDEALLAKGDEHKANGEVLNAESFVEMRNGVIVRVSPSFTNHLYVAPDGEVAKAVVALNPKTGSITVSFADAPKGKTARQIVQALWGGLAGGHDGIAGSPRDRRMGVDDLRRAFSATIKEV